MELASAIAIAGKAIGAGLCMGIGAIGIRYLPKRRFMIFAITCGRLAIQISGAAQVLCLL